MADTQGKLDAGVTVIGKGDNQSILVVNTATVEQKPSIICLYSSTDTTGAKTPYYLWVDSTGDLRLHTSIPTDEDSDGNVVGAMS